LAHIGLALILILIDFGRGITIGDHNVGFRSLYRVRQSVE
jgi:hypothetical protein